MPDYGDKAFYQFRKALKDESRKVIYVSRLMSQLSRLGASVGERVNTRGVRGNERANTESSRRRNAAYDLLRSKIGTSTRLPIRRGHISAIFTENGNRKLFTSANNGGMQVEDLLRLDDTLIREIEQRGISNVYLGTATNTHTGEENRAHVGEFKNTSSFYYYKIANYQGRPMYVTIAHLKDGRNIFYSTSRRQPPL